MLYQLIPLLSISFRSFALSGQYVVACLDRAGPSLARFAGKTTEPMRPFPEQLSPESNGFNLLSEGVDYNSSKGFCNSTPSWEKSPTFRVTTVSRCTLATAAIMASSANVCDRRCMIRAHSLKAGASIGKTA